jgi:hypothetical protein
MLCMFLLILVQNINPMQNNNDFLLFFLIYFLLSRMSILNTINIPVICSIDVDIYSFFM